MHTFQYMEYFNFPDSPDVCNGLIRKHGNISLYWKAVSLKCQQGKYENAGDVLVEFAFKPSSEC